MPDETSLALVDENTNIDKQAQILISKQINKDIYLIYQDMNRHKNQRLTFKGSGGLLIKYAKTYRGRRGMGGLAGGKGQVATPRRMNFRKSSKRPLTPPPLTIDYCQKASMY